MNLHPAQSLILTEQPVNRMQFFAPPVRAGVTVVYSRADGTVEKLDHRLTFTEALSGVYRKVYEVDTTLHDTRITISGHDLPTRDDRFAFVADVTVNWQATSPDVVVREGVRDGVPVVSRRVLALLRGISRRYLITDCERVEREINDLHLGGPVVIAKYGITIHGVTAFVTLDAAARQYLQQQEEIERQKDLTRRGHVLNVDSLRNEQDLERQRMEAVAQGVQGELQLIALHLRHHPDDALQVMQMMHNRQLELEQQRQARYASSDEIFTKMLDAGLVQAADVEQIRRQVLQNALHMVGGAPEPPPNALAVPPAAPPAGAPPAPAQTRPRKPAGGAPTAPALPPATPAPDPDGISGWRPRKSAQSGTGTN
ncbi:hypothetical protein ABZ671_29485 [Micromonospora sp. NPDC006766]|uniref:hypothetical protein n=1 Tax=Micromonospora sp. NPDC006766 TaxID=3154778 RepID=UPI003409AC85